MEYLTLGFCRWIVDTWFDYIQVLIVIGWAAAVRMGCKILPRLASLRGSKWTRVFIQVIGLWYRILIFLL